MTIISKRVEYTVDLVLLKVENAHKYAQLTTSSHNNFHRIYCHVRVHWYTECIMNPTNL